MRHNIDHKHVSGWVRLFNFLMGLLSLGALAAMVLIFVGGVLSPARWWIPAFVILAAPAVYLLVTLLFAYWIWRWNALWCSLFGVLLLVVIWSAGAFVQIRVWSSYKKDDKRDVKIMTYNVHSFSAYGMPYDQRFGQVVSFLKAEKPDIICLQEFESVAQDTTGIVSEAFAEWPHFASLVGADNPIGSSGIVIFSKYPLRVCGSVLNEGTTGGALGVDLYIEGDTVRLYNCHLQTTAFNQVNNEQGLRAILAQDDTADKAWMTASAMRGNFVLRAAQADSIARFVSESPHPMLVVGDMNSVPLSYCYQTVRADLGDAFRDQGEGYGFTYRPMQGMLRIDYVFYDDRRYQCSNYSSPDVDYSDHKPVIVTLKKKI